MREKPLRELLRAVKTGRLTIKQAMGRLKDLSEERMDFARVDSLRANRWGEMAVAFCQDKNADDARRDFDRLAAAGGNVLAIRASLEIYQAVVADYPEAVWHDRARAITLRQGIPRRPVGNIAVVAAGGSDISVAEEARVTAEIGGARVTTHYDVGITGLHKLLACARELKAANAVVAIVGVEPALASVVGGLVAVPVIAVPISHAFGGPAGRLGHRSQSASNVSEVNPDNGFAGGYIASTINRLACGTDKPRHIHGSSKPAGVDPISGAVPEGLWESDSEKEITFDVTLPPNRQIELAAEQKNAGQNAYNPIVPSGELPQSIRKLAESDASVGALLGVKRKVIEAYKLTLRLDSPRS